MSKEQTILLNEYARLDDRTKAGAAITPGMLVEHDVNGNFVPHATAGGTATPTFARENALLGKGIDTDIALGDNVPVANLIRGAGVALARLDATSANAKRGDPLESAGNGNLRVAVPIVVNEGGTAMVTIVTGNIVGYADEDVTSPGTGFAPIRVAA